MTNLLFFCLAVALGIVGWLLGSRRRPAADTRIEEELRSQLANRDRELAAARTELTTLTAAHSTAEAAARAAEENLASHKESAMAAAADALSTHSKLEQELRGLREILDSTNTQLSALKAEVTSRTMRISELEKERDQLKAELTDFRQRFLIAETEKAQLDSAVKLLREQLATERQQLEKVQEQFRKDFEGISNRLLVETSSKFNEQSRKSLDEILSPLKENLGAFKESLEKTRVETSSHSALLKDQIARIGAEAANLTKALKGDVKTLGNWGENMLDQILEKSGLQEQFHYRTQTSAKDSEGSQRFLDVIIDLPESRHLIIDSKVSLRSYEEWCNAVDEPLRAECLQRHVDSLRAHIVGLSKKRYQESHGINAPDFVLMYIPIEPAFFAAVTQSPGL
ncbi:MAG TPA: DNA recombination protein RmuC, partial [Methylomirabilota bacterium]|nr:DNA recombination protein RmuC [Methylomirabilota bacterium]